jgi:hypothetical protein
MPLAEAYRKQVALLIKIVPLVAMETSFALKGGTAINLFLRDRRSRARARQGETKGSPS